MVERATVRMTMSGFCTWPSTTGHDGCTWDACACRCHERNERWGSIGTQTGVVGQEGEPDANT